MRKILVLLSLLFINGFAEAQIPNLKSLKGAWKEVSRSRSGKKMAFSDKIGRAHV